VGEKTEERKGPVHDKAQDLPLIKAAWDGKLDRVKAALEAGADIDAKGHDHNGTALNGAARNGHADIVQFLVDHDPKPDLNSKNDGWGHAPLHQASFFNRIECAKILLEAGANPILKSGPGWESNKYASELVGKCEGGPKEEFVTLLKRAEAIAKKDAPTPEKFTMERCAGPQTITVKCVADDYIDEVFWNGENMRKRVENASTECDKMKEFTFEYNPATEEENGPVLAIGANDNEPGHSASFSLSCESSAGWYFELDPDTVVPLKVKAFGIKGPNGKVGSMGRPKDRPTPTNGMANDFDDSNWDLPI